MAYQLTIREIIARIRKRELQAREEAVALIKQIHQQPPMQTWQSEAEFRKVMGYPKIVGKPLGLHIPTKAAATFKGWYRSGQKSGMPSKRLPHAQEDLAFKQYTDQIMGLFPASEQNAILGKRSGENRAKNGLKLKIINLHLQYEAQKIPRHQRRKLIAKTLGCSVDYVNEVIRVLLKNRG